MVRAKLGRRTRSVDDMYDALPLDSQRDQIDRLVSQANEHEPNPWAEWTVARIGFTRRTDGFCNVIETTQIRVILKRIPRGFPKPYVEQPPSNTSFAGEIVDLFDPPVISAFPPPNNRPPSPPPPPVPPPLPQPPPGQKKSETKQAKPPSVESDDYDDSPDEARRHKPGRRQSRGRHKSPPPTIVKYVHHRSKSRPDRRYSASSFEVDEWSSSSASGCSHHTEVRVPSSVGGERYVQRYIHRSRSRQRDSSRGPRKPPRYPMLDARDNRPVVQVNMGANRLQDLQHVPQQFDGDQSGVPLVMPPAPQVPRIYDRFPQNHMDPRDRRREAEAFQLLIREELRKADLERAVTDLSKQEDDRKKAIADLKKQEDERKKVVAELKKQEDDKKKAIADLGKQEDDRKRNVANLGRQEDDRKRNVADLEKQEVDTKRRIENWQHIEDIYRIRHPSRSNSPPPRRYWGRR